MVSLNPFSNENLQRFFGQPAASGNVNWQNTGTSTSQNTYGSTAAATTPPISNIAGTPAAAGAIGTPEYYEVAKGLMYPVFGAPLGAMGMGIEEMGAGLGAGLGKGFESIGAGIATGAQTAITGIGTGLSQGISGLLPLIVFGVIMWVIVKVV
jgi:hypothetical protein